MIKETTEEMETISKSTKAKNRSGKRAKKKQKKNELKKVIESTSKEEREKARAIARECIEKEAKNRKKQKEKIKKQLKKESEKLLEESHKVDSVEVSVESAAIDHEVQTEHELNQQKEQKEQKEQKKNRLKQITMVLTAIVIIIGGLIIFQIIRPGWKENDEGIRYKTSYKWEFATGIKVIDEEMFIFDTDFFMEYGWIEYDGNTYYADELGVLARGYVQIDDKFYNFDEEEAMFLVGWVEKDGDRFYYQEDSTKTTGIYEIEEALFYFDEEDGAQQLGHHVLEDKKYLFTYDGIMPGIFEYGENQYIALEDYTIKTGIYRFEDVVYCLANETGEMLRGWQNENDKKYYFNPENYKGVAGWQTIDDIKYHFHADAYLSNGIVTVSGKKFYFVNGIAKSGWQTVSGNKYYFISGGGTYSGTQTIDGKSYYFRSEGYLAEGWTTISGKTYYFVNNQKVTTATKIGGSTYYFNSDGTITTGWVTSGSNKYYYNKYGVKVTGWQTISSKKYYFYSDGIMATSTSLDGYNISSSGVATLAPITSSTLGAALDRLLSKYGRSLSGAASAAKSTLSYKRMSSSGSTSANAIYALNNGRGACYHYASLTYELFKRLGYSPTYIVGVGRNAPNAHAWVSVTVNGEVRYYDSLYSSSPYTASQLKAYGYSW